MNALLYVFLLSSIKEEEIIKTMRGYTRKKNEFLAPQAISSNRATLLTRHLSAKFSPNR